VRTTLEGLARTVAEGAVRPPAVWVVGDVVGLDRPHEQPADDDADLD
jgi:uroporphyrin-III C-methyltransferase/precorrin-2 dehydrogenase/sirohydrochlorin ferrochelatase